MLERVMTTISTVPGMAESRGPVLVTAANGKTGQRVAGHLIKAGIHVREGSRRASTPLDWDKPETWPAALEGMQAVYLAYSPDLAVPGATQILNRFIQKAVQMGVKRLVLLSGRGEDEAQACERLVMDSGLSYTIVRASWFNQNFSEGAFLDMVRSGHLTLPGGGVSEPFVDVDDIAEVAATALIQDGHDGQVYEVTGPRLMHFSDVAEELSLATGRQIDFSAIPQEAFLAGIKASGAPAQMVWLMDYLFSTVLDGRNAQVCDGVQRALGRPATDFSVYARKTARTGVWSASSEL